MDMTDKSRIILTHVSKNYPVFQRPSDRLKSLLFGRFKNFSTEFRALSDINLKIREGETLGIIGRNGSGKSTLLQLIAGILRPSSGHIEVHGRVAALLELGSGFNPEFTGRENVVLNSSVLGLSNAEIKQKIDSILDFAEIGEFIDQPVKTYSSGMVMRLAFAVQAHIDADIVIVDEALAVGDVFFRQKCYRRLEELRRKGATILLVSHSMGDIEQHCDRAILLHQGKIIFDGPTSQAIKYYYIQEQSDRLDAPSSVQRPSLESDDCAFKIDDEAIPAAAIYPLSAVEQFNSDHAVCLRVALVDNENAPRRIFRAGETAVFVHEYQVFRDIEVPYAGLVIHSEKRVIVHGRNTLQTGTKAPLSVKAGSVLRFRQMVKLDVAPGDYTFEVGLATIDRNTFLNLDLMSPAEIEERRTRLVQVPSVGAFQVIWPASVGPLSLPYYGLVNLEGRADIYVKNPILVQTAQPARV